MFHCVLCVLQIVGYFLYFFYFIFYLKNDTRVWQVFNNIVYHSVFQPQYIKHNFFYHYRPNQRWMFCSRLTAAKTESDPGPQQVSSQFPCSSLSCCTSCGPVSPGNAPPPSLPSSLLPTCPLLLSGPLSLLCLLPLYLSAGMKGSVRERAPLCIHLRVFLCTCLCLRKCVFVV